MGGDFVAGCEADAGDAGFAAPVDAVGAEVPFAGGRVGQADELAGLLTCLDEGFVLFERPGGKVFSTGKTKPV